MHMQPSAHCSPANVHCGVAALLDPDERFEPVSTYPSLFIYVSPIFAQIVAHNAIVYGQHAAGIEGLSRCAAQLEHVRRLTGACSPPNI